MLSRFEKYLFENDVSNDFLVSFCKLIFEYGNFGSVPYHAKNERKSRQFINRAAKKTKINGVTISKY